MRLPIQQHIICRSDSASFREAPQDGCLGIPKIGAYPALPGCPDTAPESCRDPVSESPAYRESPKLGRDPTRQSFDCIQTCRCTPLRCHSRQFPNVQLYTSRSEEHRTAIEAAVGYASSAHGTNLELGMPLYPVGVVPVSAVVRPDAGLHVSAHKTRLQEWTPLRG